MATISEKYRPTEADFTEEVFEETLKWRDLPKGIFEILNKKPVMSQYGPSLVLTLEDEYDQRLTVWTPNRLQEAIKYNPKAQWIINRGLTKSRKKGSDKSFFDFSLKYVEEEVPSPSKKPRLSNPSYYVNDLVKKLNFDTVY